MAKYSDIYPQSTRMYNQKSNIFAMKMFNFDREFILPDEPNLTAFATL
jgi:hypothetical protein